MIDSDTSKPTLKEGSLEYCSNIIYCDLTSTKCPLIKYTPLFTYATEASAVASFGII